MGRHHQKKNHLGLLLGAAVAVVLFVACMVLVMQ